jgi:hypothetical protein
MTSSKPQTRLKGIYPMGNYWIGLTKQGGIEQYIAIASTGHVWFVSSYPSVEKVD